GFGAGLRRNGICAKRKRERREAHQRKTNNPTPHCPDPLNSNRKSARIKRAHLIVHLSKLRAKQHFAACSIWPRWPTARSTIFERFEPVAVIGASPCPIWPRDHGLRHVVGLE